MAHLTFKQGVRECIPTLFGYAGVGLSFGIVAASQKFSILEIILLCLIIYAGAAQFYRLCFINCWHAHICNCPYNTYR